MVSITLDKTSSVYFFRNPEMQKLRKLEEQGKIRLFHHVNLDKDLEELSRNEIKFYEKVRAKIFGMNDITLAQHADLCLLAKHKTAKRKFFVSLDKENLLREDSRNVLEELGIKIREPNEDFLKELRSLVK